MMVKTGVLWPKWTDHVVVAGFCANSRLMGSQLTLESRMPMGMLEYTSWSTCLLYERSKQSLHSLIAPHQILGMELDSQEERRPRVLQRKQRDIDEAIDGGRIEAAKFFEIRTSADVLRLL